MPLDVECVGRLEHRFVLDGARDEAGAAPVRARQHAAQRRVVGLGPAAREDDLARLRTEERRDTLAGVLHREPRPPPERMDRRRVAVVLAEVREHRLEHRLVERRRGGVVEINGRHSGRGVSDCEVTSIRSTSSSTPRTFSLDLTRKMSHGAGCLPLLLY